MLDTKAGSTMAIIVFQCGHVEVAPGLQSHPGQILSLPKLTVNTNLSVETPDAIFSQGPCSDTHCQATDLDWFHEKDAEYRANDQNYPHLEAFDGQIEESKVDGLDALFELSEVSVDLVDENLLNALQHIQRGGRLLGISISDQDSVQQRFESSFQGPQDLACRWLTCAHAFVADEAPPAHVNFAMMQVDAALSQAVKAITDLEHFIATLHNLDKRFPQHTHEKAMGYEPKVLRNNDVVGRALLDAPASLPMIEHVDEFFTACVDNGCHKPIKLRLTIPTTTATGHSSLKRKSSEALTPLTGFFEEAHKNWIADGRRAGLAFRVDRYETQYHNDVSPTKETLADCGYIPQFNDFLISPAPQSKKGNKGKESKQGEPRTVRFVADCPSPPKRARLMSPKIQMAIRTVRFTEDCLSPPNRPRLASPKFSKLLRTVHFADDCPSPPMRPRLMSPKISPLVVHFEAACLSPVPRARLISSPAISPLVLDCGVDRPSPPRCSPVEE